MTTEIPGLRQRAARLEVDFRAAGLWTALENQAAEHTSLASEKLVRDAIVKTLTNLDKITNDPRALKSAGEVYTIEEMSVMVSTTISNFGISTPKYHLN